MWNINIINHGILKTTSVTLMDLYIFLVSTEPKLNESTDNDKENDQPINNSDLKTDQNQTLVNRKKEIRLVNSDNTVPVSNQNSSQACLLQ